MPCEPTADDARQAEAAFLSDPDPALAARLNAELLTRVHDAEAAAFAEAVVGSGVAAEAFALADDVLALPAPPGPLALALDGPSPEARALAALADAEAEARRLLAGHPATDPPPADTPAPVVAAMLARNVLPDAPAGLVAAHADALVKALADAGWQITRTPAPEPPAGAPILLAPCEPMRPHAPHATHPAPLDGPCTYCPGAPGWAAVFGLPASAAAEHERAAMAQQAAHLALHGRYPTCPVIDGIDL